MVVKKFFPKEEIVSETLPTHFYKKTVLPVCFRVPGNECSLGANYTHIDNLDIVYSTHNADGIYREKCLESLFLEWIKYAETHI